VGWKLAAGNCYKIAIKLSSSLSNVLWYFDLVEGSRNYVMILTHFLCKFCMWVFVLCWLWYMMYNVLAPWLKVKQEEIYSNILLGGGKSIKTDYLILGWLCSCTSFSKQWLNRKVNIEWDNKTIIQFSCRDIRFLWTHYNFLKRRARIQLYFITLKIIIRFILRLF
jgi:hypothetical protein